jgi:hypothetical protein
MMNLQRRSEKSGRYNAGFFIVLFDTEPFCRQHTRSLIVMSSVYLFIILNYLRENFLCQ